MPGPGHAGRLPVPARLPACLGTELAQYTNSPANPASAALAAPQGMGRALVECVGGCTCETSVLDGWWERHASLQVMHTIRVSVPLQGGRRSWHGMRLCTLMRGAPPPAYAGAMW